MLNSGLSFCSIKLLNVMYIIYILDIYQLLINYPHINYSYCTEIYTRNLHGTFKISDVIRNN